MLRTLRTQFLLSHVLPTLLVIPFLGLVLVYLLESQVLLPALASELVGQASLAAEIAGDHPAVWHDSSQAAALAVRLGSRSRARVMLLDTNGTLLASSDAADTSRIGTKLSLPGLAAVQIGETAAQTAYGRSQTAEVVDALVPVRGPDGQILGVVRLTHQLAGISEQVARLRYVVGGVLVAGLLLGAGIGFALALHLERPLGDLTRALSRLAGGEELMPLPRRGPGEIALLTQAFNTLVFRLHDLERARRQLLANLVHELGRPLGALRSGTQALLGGADEDPELRRELLSGIDEELGRLKRLLDDLAQLHDQVLGKLDLERRPVRLREWLATTAAPWRETALAKGLHFEVSLAPDLPKTEIDPDRMAQALGNLLDNAIKYTPPGGAVRLSAGVSQADVWVGVKDSGPGIALEEQEAVFAPLYRGKSVERYPEGMGLGLAIARDLVIAHGGRLEVRSRLGAGSEFLLWMPVTLARTAQSAETLRSAL